jgi:hypothetical protein
MITELKTLLITCDGCGQSQQIVSSKIQYPLFWGAVSRLEHVETRMENEKEALCPNCVSFVKYSKKYAEATLHIITK